MRPQKLTLAALALAAGLALTACEGNQGTAGTDEGANSTASSESSADPGEEATDDGGSSAQNPDDNGPTENPAAENPTENPGDGKDQVTTGPCKTADLDFRTSHGMGEGDLMVVFRNTGDTCTFKGFPGVDLKTADSDTISAERSDLAAPVVVVKTGEESRFTLHLPRNDSGGSGVAVTSIVVTPPDETHSKTLPVSLNLPTTDGGGRPVTVDPVGTGKQ